MRYKSLTSTCAGSRGGGGGVSGVGDIGSQGWNTEAFKYANASALVLLADNVTGVGAFDDIAIPFIYAGASTVFMYQNKEILLKRAKEIIELLKKAGGPQGFMYVLSVNKPGKYKDVRGMPVTLKAGDVWKFGETTTRRYSQAELRNMIPGGVTQVPIFPGNQVEIKIAEKIAIYTYYVQTGSLPPGNKIFR